MEKRIDSEILLDLLSNLQELDSESTDEAIEKFRELIQSAIDETGRERVGLYVLSRYFTFPDKKDE